MEAQHSEAPSFYHFNRPKLGLAELVPPSCWCWQQALWMPVGGRTVVPAA